jgi:predicted transcriptional regulator
MNYTNQEKMYKALANRRRLAIVKYLSSVAKANVHDIADFINLSLKATSKHLQILKNTDMVSSHQVSLEQHYYLTKKNKYLKQALVNL